MTIKYASFFINRSFYFVYYRVIKGVGMMKEQRKKSRQNYSLRYSQSYFAWLFNVRQQSRAKLLFSIMILQTLILPCSNLFALPAIAPWATEGNSTNSHDHETEYTHALDQRDLVVMLTSNQPLVYLSTTAKSVFTQLASPNVSGILNDGCSIVTLATFEEVLTHALTQYPNHAQVLQKITPCSVVITQNQTKQSTILTLYESGDACMPPSAH